MQQFLAETELSQLLTPVNYFAFGDIMICVFKVRGSKTQEPLLHVIVGLLLICISPAGGLRYPEILTPNLEELRVQAEMKHSAVYCRYMVHENHTTCLILVLR